MPDSSETEPLQAREALGRRVRTLREAAGISQERLAVLSAVHRTYISSMERGQRNVSVEIIVRLARALDVPTARLFEDWV
jgi:transcriptional regulator with XRE-family HTH domain